MKNIVVEEFKQIPTYRHKIEIVERKGLGHPDTVCDSIMNQISLKLCDEYIKKFGVILHHNLDKALLSAGQSEIKFGGGSVIKPMRLIFGDRATYQAGDVTIPVEEIAIGTAKQWFRDNMRFVDSEKHVIYQNEIKPGSASLQDIFKRKNEVLGAGDTSAAVGYAPFTPTEMITFDMEKFLNDKKFKQKFPESGEDIKVMASRINSDLQATVAMAFVDRFIKNEVDYFRKKEEILDAIHGFLQERYSQKFKKFDLSLNTLDQPGRGVDGTYMTVTGTSADSGDCGQVGRGNRVNGVISLNRPASEEAAAGKNPVSHVGKIYNLLSFKIAKEVYDQVAGLDEVYIWLLSQIGRPINDPKLAAAQVVMKDGNIEHVKEQINNVIFSELENISKFTHDLSKGKFSVC